MSIKRWLRNWWYREPPVKILVWGSVDWKLHGTGGAENRKGVDVIAGWPGGEIQALRELNEDLVRMGATHKAISEKSLLLELIEARRAGLKVVPHILHSSYHERLQNVDHNMRHAWGWIEGLKESGHIDDVAALLVSGDARDDSTSDQGRRMRAYLKRRLPDMPLMVDATVESSPGYLRTCQDPVPDIIGLQTYWGHLSVNPGHVPNEEHFERMLREHFAAARKSDVIIFPAFGLKNWERTPTGLWGSQFYAPPSGDGSNRRFSLIHMMVRAWREGIRGYYGVFCVAWPDDSLIGLYDRKKLLETHSWPESRTYLWREVRGFRTYVASQEGR